MTGTQASCRSWPATVSEVDDQTASVPGGAVAKERAQSRIGGSLVPLPWS